MLTWLGHAGFKIEVFDALSSSEKVIYIDPWFNSPVCPDSEKTPTRADLILVTHGHHDHCSDSPSLSQSTGAPVVCIYDLASYFTNKGGSVTGMNKGGTLDLDWVSVTMVGADHSGGCPGDGAFGGSPVGFVLNFKDGSPSLYHAGDTNVFTDMKIISDLYAPQIALLPIGGHYTMAPKEAAYALSQLLFSVKTVVPMHFLTFPLLKGNPQELEEFLQGRFKTQGRDIRVAALKYGEKVPLSQLIN